ILKHLKKQPLDKNCAIYGLDSDLIMLSLSTNRNNLALVRENTLIKDNGLDIDIDKFPQLAYFIIDGLRTHIVNIMNPYTSLAELEGLKIFSVHDKGKHGSSKVDSTDDIALLHEKMKAEEFFTREEDIIRVVRDYIFISFLLGND